MTEEVTISRPDAIMARCDELRGQNAWLWDKTLDADEVVAQLELDADEVVAQLEEEPLTEDETEELNDLIAAAIEDQVTEIENAAEDLVRSLGDYCGSSLLLSRVIGLLTEKLHRM